MIFTNLYYNYSVKFMLGDTCNPYHAYPNWIYRGRTKRQQGSAVVW